MAAEKDGSPAKFREKSQDSWVSSVTSALGTLRYGSVLITVHEGRVVQIDVTEKKRFLATGQGDV